jgi:hypothetical protein
MALVRTYECPDCGARFDKLHFSRDEPPPDCPGCVAKAAVPPPAAADASAPKQRPRHVPGGFSIGGNASKAGDIAQDILEKDYGMTDIRDRQREGDISFVTPPNLKAAVDNVWSPPGGVLAAAKAAAAASAADGSNPLSIVQRANKARGTSKVPFSKVNVGN